MIFKKASVSVPETKSPEILALFVHCIIDTFPRALHSTPYFTGQKSKLNPLLNG